MSLVLSGCIGVWIKFVCHFSKNGGGITYMNRIFHSIFGAVGRNLRDLRGRKRVWSEEKSLRRWFLKCGSSHQHQHHWGPCQKCKLSGLIPEPRSQKLGSGAQHSCVFTSSSGQFEAHLSLKTSAVWGDSETGAGEHSEMASPEASCYHRRHSRR